MTEASLTPPVPPRERFAATAASIARLAAPVTLSRLGMMAIIIADTAMTGWASGTELAYYALGTSVQMVLMLIGIGMMTGTVVLTSQALGARADREAGLVWRVGMLHGLVIGLLGILVSFAGTAFFLAIGQDPDLARGGGRAMLFMAAGLPPLLIYVASTLFLEALNRPVVGFAIVVAANLVNIALNAVLIFGLAGLPAMGADGAALATSIVRGLLAATAVAYILTRIDNERFNVRGSWEGAAAVGRKLRSLGYPLGLAQGLESSAFAALTIFAGYLGVAAVAAFQATMQSIAFLFMAAIGTGTATAVHVGGAIGRGDQPAVARSGWSGVLVIALFMAAGGVVMASVPELFAEFFVREAAVRAAAVPILLVAAVTLIPDGIQGVLMGALRATGDVWVPTCLHLCSFLLVMIPGAWLFTFTWGFGPPGLMMGTFFGVVLASALLSLRFRIVSRRSITRL